MQIRGVRYGPCIVLALLSAGTAWAGQGSAAGDEQQSLQKQIARLQQEIKDADDRNAAQLKELQEQVGSLRQKAAEANEPAVVPEPNQTQSQAGSPSRIGQSFNPDISVIGDTLFHAGKNEEGENKNQFSFRELELAFSSAVDPFGGISSSLKKKTASSGGWRKGIGLERSSP
jgi:hypothetical protein